MSLLERIYFFHEELKNNRFPNAKNLVEQFEIAPATARRDIAYLRDRLLAPLAFSSQKNGFFYTEENFGLPFENSPKITFLLGMLNKLAEEAGLGGLAEVKELEKKLASLLFPEYHKVIDAVHCEWVEVEDVQSHIFETIVEAIVKDRFLNITYRSAEGRQSDRKVEPNRLINYQGRWYLMAFCSLRNETRVFHIARISASSISDEKVLKPQEPHPDYLEQSFGIFTGDIQYHATIHFSSTAAELIQHQYWHKDQEITTVSDGILLTLPVSDDREILMKVLQYGARAKVIKPDSLRLRIENEIKQMQNLYI